MKKYHDNGKVRLTISPVKSSVTKELLYTKIYISLGPSSFKEHGFRKGLKVLYYNSINKEEGEIKVMLKEML